ncbi:MAG: lactoylglutathione lyase-like lyase [Bacteroidetes bacterium]|uniref:VOC family protein n=1 Tax=Chitinophaga sp. LS1 TaxID=3051176 RepID=UPI001DB8BF54|nr:VOC family protein [Chitinophaga sp. LS1]MBP1650729.1 lactoylglutathione lyase-like lyase [Bacteroidota bacterium]WPV68772.1 VOC family protein [Chitinophaga sp. LS1]
MRQKLTLVTLGVRDLQKSISFFEDGLGWKRSSASQDGVAFFQLNGMVLSLFGRKELAVDANVPEEGSGFPAFSLALNAKDRAEVDSVLEQAANAGAEIVKPAEEVFWGGYSGYFRDQDGFLFEVAHNPFWELDEKDNIILP